MPHNKITTKYHNKISDRAQEGEEREREEPFRTIIHRLQTELSAVAEPSNGGVEKKATQKQKGSIGSSGDQKIQYQ